MEVAEHAFYRSLGFSVHPFRHGSDTGGPNVGWPRVHASCDFKQPLHFEDEVEVQMLVTEKKSKALSYEFRFRKLNADPIEEVARGKLTVVCVTRDASGRMSAATIPQEIADKIEVAPVL